MAQINTYSPDHNERVMVQYDRDRSVMVGVQRARNLDAITDAQIARDQPPPSPEFEEVDGGQWMNLDRSGINNLIRSLREARDKAYGKDE